MRTVASRAGGAPVLKIPTLTEPDPSLPLGIADGKQQQIEDELAKRVDSLLSEDVGIVRSNEPAVAFC